MKPYTSCRYLAVAITTTFILFGCASLTTVKEKPTQTTRNLKTQSDATVGFEPVRRPDARKPNLVMEVTRTITGEQTFERRYIQRRVLKSGLRASLWLSGLLIAGGGYYLYDQTGLVVVGRDLMGLGGLLPLSVEILAGRKVVGERREPEKRALPARSEPFREVEFDLTVGTNTRTTLTDRKGLLKVNITDLVDLVAPSQPMVMNISLKEDNSWATSFTIPVEVVAAHRPVSKPTIRETTMEPAGLEPPPALIAPTGPITTIAILDFEGVGVSEQEARVLTTRLGTYMVQSGRYRVIEREQMRQILEEQDFQMTGCTSNECAVEIGQLIGVEQMLAGTFGKIGSMYTIDMRIIDVETGSILRSTSYDISGTIDKVLTSGLLEATRRLVETR